MNKFDETLILIENNLLKSLTLAGLLAANPLSNNVEASPQNHTKIQHISIDKIKPLIIQNEGKHHEYAYLDTKKIPTIGYGFNLQDSLNKSLLTKLGYNVQDLINKKIPLKQQHADVILDYRIKQAKQDALSFLPNLYSLPENKQLVLIDMAYNLGLTRLNKFIRFKEALEQKNYKKAAYEMQNSEWYKQTKNRAKRDIQLMLQ